jgi:hypothetical protein
MSGLSDPLKYKKNWNQFSGDFNNQREIETLDNTFAEYAGIAGIPIDYFPINVDDFADGIDPVYGENSTPKWDRKIQLTAILDEFTPEVQSFGAVGIENIDEITLYIHRSTFDKIVGIRSKKAPKKTADRRGSWGPIAKDMVVTPHNGLKYEIMNGGLHFLRGEDQHFGHKFWYKITCKVSQNSDASLGVGEQYGAKPDTPLDPMYQGNPQFIVPTPPKEELMGLGTPEQTGVPVNSDTSGNYTTVASTLSPGLNTPLVLPDGTIANKDKVPGMAPGSKNGDNESIQKVADQIVNPQTDQVTDPGSDEETQYGTAGRVIPHKRDLWGDW